MRDIFVLRVEGGRGAYTYRPALRPGETVKRRDPVDGSKPCRWPSSPRRSATTWPRGLPQSGLFAKEARAMVNTWQTSYFQTDGIRVLFVLPQSWTDAFIPMNIEPQPGKIVRVMVGRLEMLSADRQRKAEAAIASLASRRFEPKAGKPIGSSRSGPLRRADRSSRREDDQGRASRSRSAAACSSPTS